jgi:hypothetical protein
VLRWAQRWVLGWAHRLGLWWAQRLVLQVGQRLVLRCVRRSVRPSPQPLALRWAQRPIGEGRVGVVY